jgi:hypothetical protein
MEWWSDGFKTQYSNTPFCPRASHLDLFEQPGIRVFQQPDKTRPPIPPLTPLATLLEFDIQSRRSPFRESSRRVPAAGSLDSVAAVGSASFGPSLLAMDLLWDVVRTLEIR